jgi:thiol-disulfide isomerase/thioredoxin
MADNVLLRSGRFAASFVFIVLVFGHGAAFARQTNVHLVVTVRDLSMRHLVNVTYEYDPVERREVSLDSAFQDANGTVDLRFTMDRGRPVLLKINSKHLRLFLEPGDDLQISYSDMSFQNSVTFTGQGASNCRYLISEREAGFHTPTWAYMSLKKLDARTFTKHVDSVEAAHWAFYRNADTTVLTPSCRAFIRTNITYQYIPARDMFTLQDGAQAVPVWYYDHLKELNLNDQQAWDNAYYVDAVELFLSKFGFHSDSTLKTVSTDPWVLHAYHEITRILRGPIRDVHHARLLVRFAHELADDRDLADTLLGSFRRTCRKPVLLEVVERRYMQALLASKGQDAPLFTVADEDRKNHAFPELSGKVLYVDLWATWCAPCIEAMKDSRELRTKFDTNDVAFVYINVMDTWTDWKAYSASHDLGRYNFATTMQFNDHYGMLGVPHYIIIDRNGKIFKNHAPDPDQAEELIRSALR